MQSSKSALPRSSAFGADMTFCGANVCRTNDHGGGLAQQYADGGVQ